MVIDCHVHINAFTPAHGLTSPRLLRSPGFRFMRWAFGIKGADESTERAVKDKLVSTINQATQLDAAVILAFDAVYDREGNFDRKNTHFYVTNDYVIELAAAHPRILFGASVHPFRKDAIAELERCIRAGAVLLKWLPMTQGFDPTDEKCLPFYDALAHYKLPLLSHTGGENALPVIAPQTADPMLLVPALKRGVTVIAAHCGTRSLLWDPDYLSNFLRLAEDYEHFYGDTAALNLPTRAYAYDTLLNNDRIRAKLIHGSDWPIIPIPPASHLGMATAFDLFQQSNWLQRDALIKQHLGFDDAYWHRAAKILRLPAI
jgi:predicted TIM-barrel fold metal-dependent hydrolase